MAADDVPDDIMLFNEAVIQPPSRLLFACVANGQEVLNVLEDGNVPDILFLDINMPHKNGIECLQEIRTNTNLIVLW